MDIQWNEAGLVPAVIYNARVGEVAMLGYMNEEAYDITRASGYVTFYSRSRGALWTKGDTSGNRFRVLSMALDCDGDALLIHVEVEGDGVACHTGARSCFFNTVEAGEGAPSASAAVLDELYAVITDRALHPVEGSYTNFLLGKGVDKIAKKVGEEAVETVIAAKNGDTGALAGEMADLMYHLLVLMRAQGMEPSALYEELRARR